MLSVANRGAWITQREQSHINQPVIKQYGGDKRQFSAIVRHLTCMDGDFTACIAAIVPPATVNTDRDKQDYSRRKRAM